MEVFKTRKEAKANGSNKYYTGVPCKYGHVSERLAHNGVCVACGKISGKSWKLSDKGKEYNNEYYKKYRIEHAYEIMLRSARRRAEKRNIPFNITKQDILDIWPSDNLCPIFNTNLLRNYDNNGSYSEQSPSLDCIIPNLGYIIGNIAIMSTKANIIKNDITKSLVFTNLANWLENQLNKNIIGDKL